jgi:hypothetical protein
MLAVEAQQGDEVLGPGQDEDVGTRRVVVRREPLVGLPGDGGDAERPPEAERPIAVP